MGKSGKKKRLREAMAASAPSPNSVESDVSGAAAASSSSAASSPIKHGSLATSTPVQSNGTPKNDDDDPSKWSKSKKRRMRLKGKKEAAKRLSMDSGSGGGAEAAADGKLRRSSDKSPNSKQPSASGSANDGVKGNVTTPSKPSASSGSIGDDGNSKKRQRKNPDADVVNKNDKSTNLNKGKGKKEKTPSKASVHDEGNAQKSPSKSNQKKGHSPSKASLHNGKDTKQTTSESNQKNDESKSPQKLGDANQTGADGSESSPKKKKRKKKKKKSDDPTPASTTDDVQKSPSKSKQNDKDTKVKTNSAESSSSTTNAAKPISPKLKITLPKPSQMSTLQKSFLERLTSSRFRELNEELYTHSSQHSFEHFTENPELFDQYHVGFRKQAKEWPINPVDVIYKKIVNGWKKGQMESNKDDVSNKNGEKKKQVVIVDFGCGDAKLAERLLALQIGKDGQTLTQATKKKKSNTTKKDQSQSTCPFKIFSFDLVSGGNPLVTPADMCNVPLPNESADVGVYSLALMGTNVADFVREAWRVLKFNGVLRVAEVRSRFETAATAAGDETKGGGKRGKLNNGKKHSKKKVTRVNKPQENDNDTPQPLMLLDEFISLMERCGFQSTSMDRNTNKMFLFMDFVKVDGSKGLSEKERFTAKPCMYKRR